MMINPRPGQTVQVWYRQSNRSMPHHGKTGTVLTAGKGKPRNHLIDILGIRVAVPCGNLRPKGE